MELVLQNKGIFSIIFTSRYEQTPLHSVTTDVTVLLPIFSRDYRVSSLVHLSCSASIGITGVALTCSSHMYNKN